MSEQQGYKQTCSQFQSQSKLTAETIVGEHEHTIQGYSLLKGIGDGEPIASDKFVVGGHEWVLLFYPDGKKSSSNETPHFLTGAVNQLVGNRNPNQYSQHHHNHQNNHEDGFNLNTHFNYLGLQAPAIPPANNGQYNTSNRAGIPNNIHATNSSNNIQHAIQALNNVSNSNPILGNPQNNLNSSNNNNSNITNTNFNNNNINNSNNNNSNNNNNSSNNNNNINDNNNQSQGADNPQANFFTQLQQLGMITQNFQQASQTANLQNPSLNRLPSNDNSNSNSENGNNNNAISHPIANSHADPQQNNSNYDSNNSNNNISNNNNNNNSIIGNNLNNNNVGNYNNNNGSNTNNNNNTSTLNTLQQSSNLPVPMLLAQLFQSHQQQQQQIQDQHPMTQYQQLLQQHQQQQLQQQQQSQQQRNSQATQQQATTQQQQVAPNTNTQHQNQIALAHNLINQASHAAQQLFQFPPHLLGRNRREQSMNEYAALFVALIGEAGPNPQGVVTTSDGKVVRAFHRFTLVDQINEERHLVKGRSRVDSAVKISCSKQQDPNARNCHGYRKFVKKSLLEDPNRGYLKDDTIVIRYRIELVVTQGGVLNRSQPVNQRPQDLVRPTPFALNKDFLSLYKRQEACDVAFKVDKKILKAHKLILMARSSVFRALLDSAWKEGNESYVKIEDIRPDVFDVLLQYVYTDNIPEVNRDGENEEESFFKVPFAQHLLAAADKFELQRLKRICEKRLVEEIDKETVATTLVLAEQNNAQELKRICMDFIAKHLQQVMSTDGWQYLISSAPQLQDSILQATAAFIESAETYRPQGQQQQPHQTQQSSQQQAPQQPQQQLQQQHQQQHQTQQQQNHAQNIHHQPQQQSQGQQQQPQQVSLQQQQQQQQQQQLQHSQQFYPLQQHQMSQPQFFPIQQWQYRQGLGIRPQRELDEENTRRVRSRREH